jgi:Holliday junction resolvase
MSFDNYWFKTGQTEFLTDHLQKNWSVDLFFKSKEVIKEELFGSEISDKIKPSLLFQTGYLTIKEIKEIESEEDEYDFERIYTIASPNLEVSKSLAIILLLPSINEHHSPNEILSLRPLFIKSIDNEDAKLFVKTLGDLLSIVPYYIQGRTESHYTSKLFLTFKFLGFNVVPEDPSAKGRADIVWTHKGTIIIIECKYAKKEDEQEIIEKMREAFEQIDEKEYARKYKHSAKKIILMGIVFANMGKKVEVEFRVVNKENDLLQV